MQSCNSNHPDIQTIIVDDFVSRKTGSISGAWDKGLTFGFRDCQIWHGVQLTDFDKPENNTRKHPLTDRYVHMSLQSVRNMTRAKAELERDFKSDFREIECSDQLDSSAVLNRMLAYDQFMNLAIQDMPDNKTIPEFIFEYASSSKKQWIVNCEETRNTLLWVAKRMMDQDKCKAGSLTLLLATWIEITNAVAMDKAPCKNPKGKPYFDWLDVFAFAGQPSLPSGLTEEIKLNGPGPSTKSSEVAIPEPAQKKHASRVDSSENLRKSLRPSSLKRKETTVTDDQDKRQKCNSASARKILTHIASMGACINELKELPNSRITSEERGALAERMLFVSTTLTEFPIDNPDSNDE